MEESEKRRERLKAMREEANSEASLNVGTSMPTINLANPLLESSSVPQRPTGVRRFDYYTDPMAAFSGSKRTNNHIYQAPPNSFSPPNTQPTPSFPSGPRNFYPIPPSSHQPQRTFESTPPYHSPNSWRSPVAPPFHGNHGPPPGACNRPSGAGGPPPGAWNRPGGAGGHGFPSNSSFGGYHGAGSGRGVSPRPNPSLNSYPGRGSNYTFNNSPNPGSGRGSGRGRGSHACTSARERPEMYYNESMMEDPWKLLKPVVRNLIGSEDWLPKSITKKKARTSEFTINLGSHQSLGEFLAASLEEATNDVPNV